MKIKTHRDTLDIRTALWVAFWLYISQVGEPSLLDALTAWIGRL